MLKALDGDNNTYYHLATKRDHCRLKGHHEEHRQFSFCLGGIVCSDIFRDTVSWRKWHALLRCVYWNSRLVPLIYWTKIWVTIIETEVRVKSQQYIPYRSKSNTLFEAQYERLAIHGGGKKFRVLALSLRLMQPTPMRALLTFLARSSSTDF
jgi:hypothetical protein